MESFFQRMTSMVSRNSTRVFEQDIDDDENERQRQLSYLQDRRRSAPDIHRRERLIRIPDQKGTSDEQISTRFHPRKHYNSTGKSFF
jgi:hypothetical protein